MGRREKGRRGGGVREALSEKGVNGSDGATRELDLRRLFPVVFAFMSWSGLGLLGFKFRAADHFQEEKSKY